MGMCRTGRCLVPLALIAVLGCDDAAAPTSPSPGTTPVTGGGTPVRGTERLAWNQAGDLSRLRFRVYVDEQPVDLVSVTCDESIPAACTSPLPPLTDGVHTLVLVNVDASGVESARTEAITVQKASTRASTLAGLLPHATAAPVSPRLEVEVDAGDGLAFVADVVARDIHGPAQLALLPDGRLLVAQADGLVRVTRPGQPPSGEPALDVHALLRPSQMGPLGVTRHGDFLRNRLVYVSFLEPETPAQGRLRIVRLREVGDRLGEPATIHEASVGADSTIAANGDENIWAREGPRMAFGPDGLLYIVLPLGLEFQHEPAASTPRPAVLRLGDDGRLPGVGALTGIDAHPLGLTWHPHTNALWIMFPGQDGEPLLRAFGSEAAPGTVAAARSGLRTMANPGGPPLTLAVQEAGASAISLARVLATPPGVSSERTFRLTLPLGTGQPWVDGLGFVGDAVVDSEGTVFLATSARGPDERASSQGVVMRLRPRVR